MGELRQVCMAAILLIVMLGHSLAANSATGYFVGNSLTEGVKVEGLSEMAGAREHELDTGIHWLRGAPLNTIWQAPDDFMPEPVDFGGFTNALANSPWDFVSLQPYLGEFGVATLGLDTQRLINLIDLTLSGPSSNPSFYIFTSYPTKPVGDYQAAWTQSVPDDVDQETVHARQYYEHLRQHLLNNYGQDSPIFIIPIGDVLFELDILFKNGDFPGFTGVFDNLYIDNFHLNPEFGNWIAANTIYATLLREDPTGIVKPAGFYGAGASDQLSPAQSIQLQQVIWDIVSTHPHAGGPFAETDTDDDGIFDVDDNCPLAGNPGQEDFDDDSVGDVCDTDDDNDGVADVDDIFPHDLAETEDTDNDGLGNNADMDDDGDGFPDAVDSFPLDPTESSDADGDGIGDNADEDDDGDGIPDNVDLFPLNPDESIDTDGDGVGNNADSDDDDDGFPDAVDSFPLNAAEYIDTDGDGVGDSADGDDDGDGVPDRDDAFPLDSSRSQNSGAPVAAGVIASESSGSSLGLPTLALLLLLAVRRAALKARITVGDSHRKI